VSIEDERDLRVQLSGLLDGADVRPAPVAVVIRRGRRIRVTRRISVAAGLAAAATLAAVLPGVLAGRPSSSGPITPQHYSVNVQALGPVASSGVIAQGVTDGKRWKVVVSGSATAPSVEAVGAIGASGGMSGPVVLDGPVSVESMNDSRYTTIAGNVSAAVTSLVLQLPDGERPTLTPVSWGGARWVAVVLPTRVPVVRAVAYSGTRELAYSVPFRGSIFAAWWDPGQVGPARITRSIGSGVIDGKPWHATAQIGPWGWCFTEGSGSACYGVNPKADLAGQRLAMTTCSPAAGNAPATGIVSVASDVTRVVLRLSDGTSASFRAVEVAGSRMLGYVVPAHVRVTSSTEYGSRGQVVGSASGKAVGASRTPGWTC